MSSIESSRSGQHAGASQGNSYEAEKVSTDGRNQTTVQCTPIQLVLLAFAVLAVIIISCILTYIFTSTPVQKITTGDRIVLVEVEKHPTEHHKPAAAELLLPSNLKPLHYDVTIKTYLPYYVTFPAEKNLTFDGKVNKKDVEIKQVLENDELEKVKFILSRKLQDNEQIKLELSYTGKISNTLGGLYQTTYLQEDGKSKIAAITQFEPTDARQMVPCFDEPKYKAKWTVTVIHPKGTRAISNGIETGEKKDKDGQWITTKFKTTPLMSSYLLAIFVSEFQYIEQKTKNGIRLRVWSRPEAKMMTQYALSGGIRCLEFYEQYFGINYPLEKQDMVALPDFAAGAMENWGLITYRESILLYDSKLYDTLSKQLVAMVVAHELSHQWFGNLVTMKWWDDLWLNEGFATMAHHIGADEISNHQMKMRDYFLLNSLSRALVADSLASSHPISLKIERASEIHDVFDSISYNKGASLLFMVSALITENNFKKAVTMGYPIVTVECFNSTTFKISQQRYKRNKKAQEPERYRNPIHGFKWDVPIWYQMLNEKVKQVWLKRDEPLYLPIMSPNTCKTPMVINADRYGFYRQNYDSNGWMTIIDQLNKKHEVFSSRTRNAIISDVFAAAEVDLVEYETVFRLLSYLKNEKEYLPWVQAISSLDQVVEIFGNEPESKYIKRYVMDLLMKMYNQIKLDDIAKDYENDNLFIKVSRDVLIMHAYCALGSDNCKKKFKELFDEHVMANCQKDNLASQCVSIAAPLRSHVYCYGVEIGGETAFEKVMELYKAERVQIESNRLLRALGCHRDVASLKLLLQLALDRTAAVIRLQDVAAVFQVVSRNIIGREFVFDYLIENWEKIYKR
ncbi:peptidase family M1 [Dictyocaulus viviparus]|uniref:Aminopeptidase n=1 Tax=Dictyocaulus viviparus TaxID=29172 RepID=A0A0D8XYS4_DICVI|nr:peptidase family M1 [Dictyocaulus viviparus]